MRFLIFLLLALSAGIGLTTLSDKPGYILISRQPWSFETTLLVFILGLLATFLLFYVLLRLLDNLISAPARLKRWQKKRNLSQATEASRKGMLELILGHLPQAKRLLSQNVDTNPQADINLLACAWIAQQENSESSRDSYLTQAMQMTSSSKNGSLAAVGLVQCQLMEQAGQFKEALEEAQALHQQTPANPVLIRCLIRLLEHEKKWQELLETLIKTSRYSALPEEESLILQISSAKQLFATCKGEESLQQCWKSLPKGLRKNNQIISAYCQALIGQDLHGIAETLIRTTLKNSWSDELVGLYGRLNDDNPAKLLKNAEHWLAEHPTETPLMLAMGRLAIKSQLWGMARSYLEIAAQNGDSHQAALELGWLYESLGESDAATKAYRKGLEHSLGSLQQNYAIPLQSTADQETDTIVAPTADSVKMPHSPSLAYTNESK